MFTNRKVKKWIIILTGVVFLSYPAFDYYIASNKEPFIFMYVVSVIIGLGYLVYGLIYK